MKNILFSLSEKYPFLVVKFSIHLNRRVFVASIKRFYERVTKALVRRRECTGWSGPSLQRMKYQNVVLEKQNLSYSRSLAMSFI